MDDQERLPDRARIGELPHRPPKTGKPYTKEEVLAYWNICDSAIDRAVDALDITNPDCGFFWYKVSKKESISSSVFGAFTIIRRSSGIAYVLRRTRALGW